MDDDSPEVTKMYRVPLFIQRNDSDIDVPMTPITPMTPASEIKNEIVLQPVILANLTNNQGSTFGNRINEQTA